MMTLKAMLEKWEGRVHCLYLDGRGNVTTGIGHLLPTAESACDLPFTMAAGAILATPADITREYIHVKALEPNMRPMYYTLRTQLRLSDEVVDSLLDIDIRKKSTEVVAAVDGFAAFPSPAQTALMDMAVNLGTSGLLRYPKLLGACKRGEWRVAASECHRKGISEERNDATAELFRGLIATKATVA